MAYSVGGKNANLGELRNMLDMPVPRGFSITIRACSYFLLRTPGLFKNLFRLLKSIDPEKPARIAEISQSIDQLVQEAPIPAEVEQALFAEWDAAFGKNADVVVALRSSAIAEDGMQSFAGQYRQYPRRYPPGSAVCLQEGGCQPVFAPRPDLPRRARL